MDGRDEINVSRRTLLGGAALASVVGAVLATAPAIAEEAGVVAGPAPALDQLPRKQVALVDPPFVHAHEQVATSGPQVVEFTLMIEEKDWSSTTIGTTIHAMTFNGIDARPADGGA